MNWCHIIEAVRNTVADCLQWSLPSPPLCLSAAVLLFVQSLWQFGSTRHTQPVAFNGTHTHTHFCATNTNVCEEWHQCSPDHSQSGIMDGGEG